jgi:hypothetical protein
METAEYLAETEYSVVFGCRIFGFSRKSKFLFRSDTTLDPLLNPHFHNKGNLFASVLHKREEKWRPLSSSSLLSFLYKGTAMILFYPWGTIIWEDDKPEQMGKDRERKEERPKGKQC